VPAHQLHWRKKIFRDSLRQPFLVIARISANGIRRAKVNDQHVDRSVGLRLEDELAIELQRCAEQYRENDRLRQKLRYRLGIVVTAQNIVKRRP